jgi:hypothetical protein
VSARCRIRLPLIAVLLCLWITRGLTADDDNVDNARPPRGETELRAWLENMVWHHHFSDAEIREATGLSQVEIAAALKKFDIRPETKVKRKADAPLLVLPYPGGRHPRIGFLDGAARSGRQRSVSLRRGMKPATLSQTSRKLSGRTSV